MKMNACIHSIAAWCLCIFVIFIFGFSSCNKDYDDLRPESPKADTISFKKTAHIFGIPALELSFRQSFDRRANGDFEASRLFVTVSNLTTIEINHLQTEIVIYHAKSRNAEDIQLKTSISLETLPINASSPPSEIFTNYSSQILDPEMVELRILSYPDGYENSGSFAGYLSAYRIDSSSGNQLLQQNPIQLSIAADGLLTAWVVGESQTKKVVGTMSPDHKFIGTANALDGSTIYRLLPCDTCNFDANNGLSFALSVEDSSLSGGIQLLEFDLQKK